MLYRSSLRYLGRHPWQTGLSILGIALGVAVVVSIDLANASARRAFLLSAESVTGRATHQVVGGPAGVDEQTYVRLRMGAGVRPAAPVVEGYVATPDFPGRTFHLLGIDPLAEGPFRPHLSPHLNRHPGAGLADLAALLTQPATGLLSSNTARELGLAPGGTLVVRVAGVRRTIRLVGLIMPGDATSRQALESLIVTDIAMPSVDGLALAEVVTRKGLHTPVIFVTGQPGDELEVKGLELGAVDYIRKPIQKDVLLLRVRKALRAG